MVDYDNSRIQKFNSSGTFITKWGSSGSGDGQFAEPQGIAVDSSGNVYVADHYNNRIQKFDSSGTFITKWGSSGSGDGQFDDPTGIAVDSSGNVYVADRDNYRIQKFAPDSGWSLYVNRYNGWNRIREPLRFRAILYWEHLHGNLSLQYPGYHHCQSSGRLCLHRLDRM